MRASGVASAHPMAWGCSFHRLRLPLVLPGRGPCKRVWSARGGYARNVIDRIADPWGERTPFGRGEAWPVREDAFLEEGVAADEVDRWVQSASILHSNGDGLDIAVKDGRIVGV